MTVFRDIIAVGASAGGVEALRALAGGLPPDYPGVVLVVLHIPRASPSALPAILSRSGPLPAHGAVDGEPVLPGHIYVARSDHHLLLLDGRLRLSHGPSENGHRPAIDPLFRSVALAAGPRAVGVVLSGARDDGAAGLGAIVSAGGGAIVQDPAEALYPWMPQAALRRVVPDHVLPAAKIGGQLGEMATMTFPEPARRDDALLDAEVDMSDFDPVSAAQVAPAAGYGCPDCGGSLFEMEREPHPRFRCRIGHAWSPESLLDEQAVALEGALWTALRALEEKSALSRRMAGLGNGAAMSSADRFTMMADEAQAASDSIRKLISQLGSTAESAGDAPAVAGGHGSDVR